MPRALPCRALLGALACLAAACEPRRPPPVELVHLDAVDGEILAPGDPLHLAGEGLPPGRRGRLRFEGEVRSPGVAAAPMAFEVPLTVDGEGRATAPIPPGAPPGRRRALAGRLEVRFPSAHGPDVIGTLPRAALLVAGSEAPADRLRLDRAVSNLGERLGWVVAERDGAVAITDVTPGGRAAGAGLAPGDVLLAVAAFPVAAPEDLLGPDGEPPGGRLTVHRPGERTPRVVDLTPAVEARVGWPPGSLPLALVGAWVGGLALSARRRVPRPASTPPGPLARLLQGVAVAVPPALALALPGRLPLPALWGVWVLGRALAAPALAPSPSRVVVAVLRATLATAPAAATLVLVGAMTGEGTLGGLVAQRMDRAPAALALASPALLLCLPALAHAVDRPGPGLAAAALRAFGAGATVAVLGGGWAWLPGLPGHAVYAVAAVAVLAAFEQLGRRPGGVPAPMAWAGVALAVPAARLWSEPSVASLALPVAAAAAGAWLLGALGGRVRPAAPPPAHPFA